jgi:hypothetical protein
VVDGESPVVPAHHRFDKEANPKRGIHVTRTDQHRKHDSGWYPSRIIFGHHLIFSIVTSSALSTCSADVLTRYKPNRLERGNRAATTKHTTKPPIRHRSQHLAGCARVAPRDRNAIGRRAVGSPRLAVYVSAACIAPACAKRRMRFSAPAASPCLLPRRTPRSAVAGRSNSPGSHRRIRLPGTRVAPWSRRLPR